MMALIFLIVDCGFVLPAVALISSSNSLFISASLSNNLFDPKKYIDRQNNFGRSPTRSL